MITSDRQLSVTMKQIDSLHESLEKLSKDAQVKPLTKASMIQTKALIKELQAEVAEYEDLKINGVEAIELNDLSEVMLLPIKYRIAKKMTQEHFAKIVDVPLRMIARYESDGYKNISGEKLHKILSKLHLKILGKLKEV